jgi:hypothetical protein
MNKYRIAGVEVNFDRTLNGLDRLFLGQNSLSETIPEINIEKTKPQIVTEGWVVDRHTRVSIHNHESGFWLAIDRIGLYWIEAGGNAIQQVSSELINEQRQQEVLLGAPLIYALASQGVWCLHASAIAVDEKIILFLGVSGSGKSTLVEYLVQRPGIHFAADDILPVKIIQGQLLAYPHFPQLKRPLSSQPGFDLSEEMPVSKIFALFESPEVSISSSNEIERVEMLIRHTAAVRLFDPKLLSDHLDFCIQAVSFVPVKMLCYPRTFSTLFAVSKAIITEIMGSSS